MPRLRTQRYNNRMIHRIMRLVNRGVPRKLVNKNSRK